ncbi:MAG: Smr/MutS family protein [Rhodospirillaceae bacterium]|nr:Smr/MutS family protein [Rhodospirillaceae bacterium]
MAGKRRLTEQELALWQAVASTVAPLKRKRRKKDGSAKPKPGAAVVLPKVPEKTPVKAAPPAKAAKAPPPKPAAVKPAPLPPLLTPSPIPGAMPGIDKRQGERFRRGQMPIEGKIDLHGRTQNEAHDALLHFIERAHKAGKRKLLVITGKGMTQGNAKVAKSGILKSLVPRWLNEPIFRRLVLAISQARPEHGGEGALYVLLKRIK